VSEAPPIITTRDVTRVYHMRGDDVHALRGVNLDIPAGEYVSILGPSGSGKSTLFNMIGGLDRPTSGVVRIAGVDLSTLDSRSLAWFRCCRIGYIFQTFNLIPTLSALENVMLAGTFRMLDDDEARRKAADMLTVVGLGDRMDHRPEELSGGQMQRVAIARALVNEPKIILADEPTGNLDLQSGTSVIETLRRLNQERGVSIITATHDHKMLSVSDRILWFSDGQVERVQLKGEFEVEVGHIE
jgi:putative ABC transport system ATP-binding protein